MRRICAVSLTLLALAAGRAECLELKNGRASYGPLLGATRPNNKFLPGDIVYFNFEIDKLTTKEKTGLAVYKQSMEVINQDTKKTIFKEDPAPQEMPLMIGAPVRTYVQVYMPPDTLPGSYKLKINVTDRGVKPAVTKMLEYDFELTKPAFGIVATSAPAVVFPGDMPLGFGIVGMAKDKKTKLPDVDIAVRVLDESGKLAFAMPFTSNLKDLPLEASDLTKMAVVPVATPLAMNRVGRFTLEVQATDKLSKQQQTVRLPVTVLDPTPYLGASK